ncbi:putative protein phosphatase 2C 41 isoform X1 [Wolffia australiana]
MELIPGLLSALAKSLQGAKKKTSIDEGRKAAEAMAREARKNGMILRSSGSIVIAGSSRFISCSSRRGEKGMNQDFSVVWKDFGCQEDLMFCGIFDGHGSWGREVARLVGEFLPSFLLCNWQETLVLNDRMDEDLGPAMEKKLCLVDVWKRSYLRACAAMDREISLSKSLDPFYSGSTALTAIIQGDLLVLANVGDSRAVLATSDASGRPVPVQLSLDFKPSLPEEAERIKASKGQVFCLEDEPGVARVWRPCGTMPGLAMSRAFGDFSVKDFGLISTPDITHRTISPADLFLILATDGVWDVVSNMEAVQIVSSAPNQAKAAECLVRHATAQWRRRRHVAADDCSALCIFFRPPP